MKITLIFIFYIFVSFFKVFADADFDDDFLPSDMEERQYKKVRIYDNKFIKELSIFFINSFQFTYKIIRPVFYLYGKATTENFKYSVSDASSLLYSANKVAGGLLVFSPQRAIANLGTFSLNVTLGFFNASKEFDFEDYSISVVDVLRFYNVPETFVAFLPFPMTLTSLVGEIGAEVAKDKLYSLNFFGADFIPSVVNNFALNLHVFDITTGLEANQIYNQYSNAVYYQVRNFYIERKPFKKEKRNMLKNYLDNKEYI